MNVQTNRKPDMKKRYYDGRDFFRGHESDRRGHRRSHNQNTTCDKSVHSSFLSYNTSPRSEVRHARPRYNAQNKRREFTFSFYKMPNGRDGMNLHHYDHELGSCQDCRNTKVRKSKDGKLYAERYEVGCTIL